MSSYHCNNIGFGGGGSENAIVKYTLSLRILEHHTKRNANVATGPCKLYTPVVLQIFISTILQSNSSYTLKTVAIDTPGGKRNLKMKIKAQQMTFRQDITKYKIYWLTFRCIVHNIFRAIKLIYKRVLYIYTNNFKRLQYSNKRIRGRMKNNLSLVN